MNRKIVVVLSDTHGGYSFGLCPPDIKLPPLDDNSDEEFETPKLTKTQKELWKWFTEDSLAIQNLADGDHFYLLHIGDMIQGNVLPRQFLIDPRLEAQLIIAEEVIMHFAKLKNCKGGRFVKGTSVHNAGHGTAEGMIARAISNRTKKDFKSKYHMIFDLFGIRFDIAHHGPNNSSREWLEGNTLRYYTRDIVARHLKNGDKPPDVILRGHYHDRKIELWIEHLLNKTVKCWSAICPAYALFMDDYTLKVTKSKPYMTIGMFAIEIIDGVIKDIHDFTHTVDIRRRETVG